jgi:hypothetical protein
MTLAFPPLDAHLLSAWPTDANRQLVLSGYEAMKQQPLLLADIALQGGVFLENSPAFDAQSLAIFEGRRQMALRLIKAAGTDPLLLFDLIERRKPRQKSHE